ncbi:MAG: aldo/keto reductase, partial [Magnetococcales bacterium]|nr:aldo/keto reductase [Magnetococcales bacterium]
MERRTFIKSATLLAAAGVSSIAGAEGEAPVGGEKARVKRYRPLGKTGIQMSDISFGAGKLSSAALVLRAIDRGVNYFDTAPDYGPSEDFIGEALRKVKARDKSHIVSKYCNPIPYQSGK